MELFVCLCLCLPVIASLLCVQVLEACSKCFESLCCEEYAIAGKCDVARKTLIDSLVVKFHESVQDFFAEVGACGLSVLHSSCDSRNFLQVITVMFGLQSDAFFLKFDTCAV